MTNNPHTLHPAEDIPLGGLPSADPTLLGKAPLEVAVIEIRYTAAAAEIAPEAAAALRDELVANTGVDYPSIQPAVQQQMRIDSRTNRVSRSPRSRVGGRSCQGRRRPHHTLCPTS